MSQNLAYLPKVDYQGTGSELLANADSLYYYVYGYDPTGATETDQVNNAKAHSSYVNYGVLYNWNAAQIACPTGWHLPTDAEHETLAATVAQTMGNLAKVDDDWSAVAIGLKSTTRWTRPNANDGKDLVGFNFLPGGYRTDTNPHLGWFWEADYQGHLWSATEATTTTAYKRATRDLNGDWWRDALGKGWGISIRCVMD